MKHKHYEMIVAKAADLHLTVFCKGVNDDCEWHEIRKFPNWQNNAEYFLCQPQHREACLHWLSGGNIQYRIALDAWTDAAGNVSNVAWTPDNLFIDDQVEFRIKPKKEKRWIVWDEDRNKYHCTFGCNPKGDYSSNFKYSIHEIEVEVKL
ncbi:hypothetical protein NVP1284A_57 [Vibrio phage 1.284.A._10N.286.55.A5]|nr:hypothetical protein NVP1284A_57 [Vibrio phage 1.284.A._10N.286.55.A5]AUS01630.1 hypothetical protein NVP1287O_57 [Vibrio phage 1.287.O._10N.286.55.C7]AUS01700.1 hypothetical protein NVP1289A_56 [Vibrio phage 1.289.A._10N.286.55.E8]